MSNSKKITNGQSEKSAKVKPREHVMKAYRQSHKEFASLYKKLAEN